MKPPADDLDARSRIWDQMQYFWMDTDPACLLPQIARVCAESAYSIEELEAIFWNEVRPAVAFNLLSAAPEWRGFEIQSLQRRILAKHRYGRPLPWRRLHADARKDWESLRAAVAALRGT
ncbi:MAG TPA: hypothetical protein VLF18_16965 [Tahibacter sp.]|uniref:DUF7079 family protein n=1 Tax=Tahibacter sp. TaxID=2056211 RepID=UPI002BDE1280|nr:hypothetical protein [Tahibacter sp.]HSX61884.1 hypothetical protein [Tahibacter sp.]